MKKPVKVSIIVYVVLILLIPFIIVKIGRDEKEIIRLFLGHVVFIIPLSSIGLRWYKLKSAGVSTKEIFKSFIPFYKVKM